MLSLLAKRSYPLYRLWYEYEQRTCGLFDGHFTRAPIDQLDQRIRQFRDQGYLIAPSDFPADAIRAARDYVLDRYKYSKRHAERVDPGGAQGELRWEEGGITYEIL